MIKVKKILQATRDCSARKHSHQHRIKKIVLNYKVMLLIGLKCNADFTLNSFWRTKYRPEY